MTLIWCLTLWLLAAWAGWQLEANGKPMLAVIPSLALTLGVLDYGGHRYGGTNLLLAFTLLLIAAANHDRRRAGWDARGIASVENARGPLTRAAFGLTIGLVLVASSFPSFSIQTMREWWTERRQVRQGERGQLAESLGISSAPRPPADPFQDVREPGLPQQQLIGAGPDLSERLVMSVSVDGLGPSPDASELPLYWRSLTYDQYIGRGWGSSDTEERSVSAGEPWRSWDLKSHFPLEQDIRVVPERDGIVFAA
nr:hypothetical protein [Anaerolineae bacterium]